MKPEEYAALYKLEMLPGERLPSIAMEWIESGQESQALIELAWEHSPTLGDAALLFEKALTDIGIEIPDKPRALELLANIYCKKIVSGELTPFEGASIIWQIVCIHDEAPVQAFEFVTYADALQNQKDPEAIAYFNKQIIQEANKFVSQVNV